MGLDQRRILWGCDFNTTFGFKGLSQSEEHKDLLGWQVECYMDDNEYGEGSIFHHRWNLIRGEAKT